MSELRKEVISHHLRLLGFSMQTTRGSICILIEPGGSDISEAVEQIGSGGLVVAVVPEPTFLAAFGVSEVSIGRPIRESLNFKSKWGINELELKTLHPARGFSHPQGEAVVKKRDGVAVWLWLSIGAGGLLILGTDIASDLIHYRQGDPACADNRPTEVMWGIAGERPNYLFDTQLAGQDIGARQADWWAIALAESLGQKSGQPLEAMLPGDAPGAIVITGDDDQAHLEKYDAQLTLIGDIPITYLLHPLTRHTPKTLRAMQRKNPGVDFGIHPDALNAPQNYNELFDEQVAWYRRLTGMNPISLRNHGFLNEGYWGHLDAWLRHGIKISSNLPGLDGHVLNGSLLPARIAWKGQLTHHWSVLTAIGDGVRFISGMSEQDAADCVWALAERIKQSRFPGVMVLNLHPQNIAETSAMHIAAKEIIRSGFVAWNLRQCLQWFQQRDDGSFVSMPRRESRLASRWRHIRNLIAKSMARGLV